MPTETTNRGLGIYGRISTRSAATIRVQESSLAGEGAHVWLFLDGDVCKDFTPHTGGWRDHVPMPGDTHSKPDAQLSVAQAKNLIAALQAFIAEAEADELTEPAEATDG